MANKVRGRLVGVNKQREREWIDPIPFVVVLFQNFYLGSFIEQFHLYNKLLVLISNRVLLLNVRVLLWVVCDMVLLMFFSTENGSHWYFFEKEEKLGLYSNSLGALDGKMILVNVPCKDRSKYRTRKGTLAMNVLGVCSPEMVFIYVLPGWEGSAHDGRILRDAISRPNGLKVPKGYTNGEGFLAPYRGHLYHLREWNNPQQPQIAEEYFNLRHAKARNVIERCFGLLKGRWGILRSPSWFSLQTHGRIVLACALLHNLVKRYMLAEFGDEDLMDESSASGGGRGKNKRFWTAQEDKVLVEALSELAVDPHWRCDNGFRSGYMVRLEEVIGKALPGCGLKALPHIDSRLKTLGAKFRAISQMLNTSGFVWDDEKKMVSVDRAVYDEFCKNHPNCKNLFGVLFPHFHELMNVYGKDYATRKPGEDYIEAIKNLQNVAPPQVTLDSSDDEEVAASGNATQIVTSPPAKKMKTEKTSKRSKRGNGGEGSSNELASLQAFMKDMNVHLSTMANVMARTDDREQKIVEKTEQVLEELLSFNLEGVTPNQVFEVANILTAQPNKLIIFSKCPDALKSAYVKSLIGGNSNA
ncbi:uncharacterized protein LOC130798895 [Amaranthus tricolor]|uniref:uncharacterized protein LOC130798895 n=1 Tax=Amaranthus tricolor TaxID=29722 RepID=UPI002590C7EA|nr:uncharacterized protein LOC130798895 [Amaranthus tricolor]